MSTRPTWMKLSRRRAAVRKLRLLALRSLIWAGAVVVIISAGFSIVWWQDGTLSLAAEEASVAVNRAVAGISQETDMVVQEVVVEGRQRAPAADIEKAVAVEIGDPMLTLDLVAIKQRLEEINWVGSAEVYRTLPGTIRICINERVPVALLQEKGKLSLIDKTGKRIEKAAIDEYSYLPVVSGEGSSEHSYRLVTMLATTPDILGKISSAVRVGNRRWNVKFYNGIEVMLPEKNEDVAWADFSKLQKYHAILDKAVLRVDLRQEGRAYVRMADGAEPVIEGKGGDSI